MSRHLMQAQGFCYTCQWSFSDIGDLKLVRRKTKKHLKENVGHDVELEVTYGVDL